ncbi:MAG TPA: ParB/RepB/Spo0J family partition protein [Candidatus Pristimantibacillus sp.]|nr:ParB/RepB/Spo0J family partition protein [Candidatus Pristimantibacillus sp.]
MSTIKKSGLGRGFDALIPKDVDTALLFDDQERIQKLAVAALEPNPHQPRTTFDEEALQQLADSIKQYGILQPLVVTPQGAGKYAIIAGERRWRAAQLAGESRVPVIVRTTKELESLEIALVENVQRVDLSPLEQAISIERLHQQFSMTYESIAKRLGKASSTINNIVRLLQLPKEAREALETGQIFEGHARAILSLKDMPDKQAELLGNIKRHGWSVRQAEQFVTSVKEGYQEKSATRERMQTETPQTKLLSKKIGGSPVHIRRMAKGGKLEIGFKSDEELDRILSSLS